MSPDPARDEAGKAQRALYGEANGVLQEARPHNAVHEGGVLSVDKDRDPKGLGFLEKGQERRLSQALAVHVTEDLDPMQPKSFDALKFLSGQLNVLHRQ